MASTKKNFERKESEKKKEVKRSSQLKIFLMSAEKWVSYKNTFCLYNEFRLRLKNVLQ
jgi:hypothetical protein